jgi:hypothetical protein
MPGVLVRQNIVPERVKFCVSVSVMSCASAASASSSFAFHVFEALLQCFFLISQGFEPIREFKHRFGIVHCDISFT